MRALRLLAPRVTAFILALIMVFGLFPILPQPAYAEDSSSTFADAMAGGQAVPVEEFGYQDVDFPDIYASDGNPVTGGVSYIKNPDTHENTVSYCLDHGNPAPYGHYDEMIAKANENLRTNPLLLSVFFFGSDNRQKNFPDNMESLFSKWLQAIPELQGKDLDYLGALDLPADKADQIYERATQLAIWVTAHINWDTGDCSDQRLGIEGTMGFLKGSGLTDLSHPYGGPSSSKHNHNYIPMGGNNNKQTTSDKGNTFTANEKQLTLKMAKQLITLGSWMAYKGWSPINMEPELKIYPVAIGDNVRDRTGLDQFWDAGSSMLDFSSFSYDGQPAEEVGKTFLSTVYKEGFGDFIRYDESTHKYIIDYQVLSATQKVPIEGAPNVTIHVYGADGTEISGGATVRFACERSDDWLAEDEARMVELGLDKSKYQNGPNTPVSCFQVETGTGTTRVGDEVPSYKRYPIPGETDSPVDVTYVQYFQLEIPENVAEHAARVEIEINDQYATFYPFRVHWDGDPASGDLASQYFICVNSSHGTENKTNAKWLEPEVTDIVTPTPSTPTPTPPTPPPIKRVLHKVDSNGSPMMGVRFRFSGPSGEYYFTTDNYGEITLQWGNPDNADYIPPGTYDVEEVEAPIGYLRDERIQPIFFDEDGVNFSGELEFRNIIKDKIILKKVDMDGNPVAGVKFHVWHGDTYLGVCGPTDANGEFIFDGNYEGVELNNGLMNGTYIFQEAEVPEGFILSDKKQSIDIKIDAEHPKPIVNTLIFQNARWPEIIIRKIDTFTGKPVPGALFRITIDGVVFAESAEASGANAEFRINYETYKKFCDEHKLNMEEGIPIVVQEMKAPSGYNMDIQKGNTHTLNQQLTPGSGITEFLFADTPYRKLIVEKRNALTGELVDGARFTLRCESLLYPGSSEEPPTRTLEAKGGTVEFDSLPYGTYILTEESAPKGYTRNTEEKTIVIGPESALELHEVYSNNPMIGIHIVKIDSITNKKLAGAKFHVSINGGQFETDVTTGANGEVFLSPDQLGGLLQDGAAPAEGWQITVTEFEAPAGYNIDPQLESGDNTLTTHLKDGDQTAYFTFKDSPMKKIRLVKIDTTDTTQKLAGARFLLHCISLESGQPPIADQELVTGPDGSIESSLLPFGTYEITEIAAPSGYMLYEFHDIIKISASDPAVKEYTYRNTPYPGIHIFKRDSITNELVDGAKFEVWVGGVSLGTFVTGQSYDGKPASTGEIYIDLAKHASVLPKDSTEWEVKVTEVEAPPHYNLSPQYNGTLTFTQTMTAESGRAEFVFTDVRFGKVQVLKLDKDTSKPLPGTVFELRCTENYSGAPFSRRGTTNAQGIVEFDDLPNGIYELREVEASTGYVLDGTVKTFVIDDETPRVMDYTFDNYPYPGIHIFKRDADTNEPLAGAQFEVYVNGTKLDGTFVTDETGRIDIDFETYGKFLGESMPPQGWTVTVKEIKAPTDYNLNELPGGGFEETRHVTSQDVAMVFNFEDTKMKMVQIEKVDATDTSVKLEGARFLLECLSRLDGGELIEPQELVTGPDGKIISDRLPFGTYRLTEIAPPYGYMPSGRVEQFTISPTDPEIITFTWHDVPQPRIHILKHDAENGELLNGAVFNVKVNGIDLGQFETGKAYGTAPAVDGEVWIYLTDYDNLLQEGTDHWEVIVEEVRPPEGYNLSMQENGRTYFVDTLYSSTGVLEFNFNDSPLKTVKVMKLDANANEVLAGAKFQLECLTREDGKEGFILEGESGPDGIYLFEDLPNGTYRLREIEPPVGYLLDEQVYEFEITGDSPNINEFTFENYPHPGIHIFKRDMKTHELLAGAEFKVDINGQTIGTFITDESGHIHINWEDYKEFLGEHMPPEGWMITVTETMPPVNYNLSEQPGGGFQMTQWLTEERNTITFDFYDYEKNNLRLWKIDAITGEKLSNAVFSLHCKSLNDGTQPPPDQELVTNEDGYVDIEHLPDGTYSVTETTPPPGHFNSGQTFDFEVHGSDFSVHEFVFENYPVPDIIIYKKDSRTRELLPGAVFNVQIDGTDFQVQMETDETGKLVIPGVDFAEFLGHDLVPPTSGWTITVTEVRAPQYYNRDLQEGGTYTQTQNLTPGRTLMDFEFFDNHYKSIKVWKRDAENGWLLAGAKFKLHCVSLVDESLDAGTLQDLELTTGPEGYVIFDKLPDGTYTIEEINPPYGYHGNTTVATVVINAESEDVIEVSYENEPKSGILIRKIDAMTKQPIPNTKFEITPLAPLTDSPFEAMTDENGLIVIENLPTGSYSIREISVPDGYMLNSAPQVVNVDAQHNAYTVTFENNQKNMLNILKLDGATMEPLAGAVFEVRKTDGTLVATVTTGANGYASVPNLEPGGYVVREIQAPPGHVADPNPQTFEVKEDDSGKIYTLVFCNTEFGNLYIYKYDSETGIGLEGAHFRIWKDNEILVEDAVTDSSGYFHLGNLTDGMYRIEETLAPSGYINSEEEYSKYIKTGETASFNIPNDRPGSIAIHKTDVATGEPLVGAVFELYTLEGQRVNSAATSTDGWARFSKLDPGTYVLKEVSAPDGYIVDATPRNVTVTANKPLTIEWPNSKNAGLTILKRDAASGVLLSDAEFEIRDMDDKLIGTVTTDTSGMALYTNLEPGWYKVKETKAPRGYMLNTEEQVVEVVKNAATILTFEDIQEKGITLKKIDALTGQALGDAKFEIRSNDGKLIETVITNSSGIAQTENVEPGRYTITEVEAPEGYVLLKEPIIVDTTGSTTAIVTIPNYPENTIQIHKTDSTNDNPLAGAEFEIRTLNGDLVGTVVTNSEGWAYSNQLVPGTYVIVEVKAPTGYSLDPTEYKVVLGDKDNAILQIKNAPDTSLHITKIDSVTREPLAGAEFELRYDTGHGDCVYIGTYTTDEFGMIHTEPLEPGFYMIKEIHAPNGYAIKEEEVRFCVKAGEYNQLIWEDDALGTLIVRKIDSKTGMPIAGAQFKLETADHELIGMLESDANGEAIFTGLTAGHYIVTEMQAPPGYQLSCPSSKTITIEYGKNNYCDFVDAENGSLVIILQDKYTGEYLYGGAFTVYQDDVIVYENKTDVTGTIVVGNLAPGAYRVVHTKAPNGYTIGDVEIMVEVISGEQQIVYFKDYTAGMIIEKVDSQYPTLMLTGARFKVVRDEDNITVGEYVTDASGIAQVSGLTDGMYTVTEIVAPLGYSLTAAPQKVHVRAGTVAHVTFLDTAFSSITINVVNQATQAPIAGVTVEVWNINGILINTYVTDVTGVIQTDHLPAGTYKLIVTNIPDGYILENREATVELQDGIETTYKFELYSEGGLKIMSVDSTGHSVPGMTVQITELDGTVIGSYTTNVDGIIQVPTLKPGWYLVTETEVPNGCLPADPNQYRVQIKSGEQAELIFWHGKTVGVQVATTCKQTGHKIAGVEYEIRRPNGEIMGKFTSDNAGIFFAALKPGTYLIYPVSAPEGFQFEDMTPRRVDVKADVLTTVEFFVTAMSSLRVRIMDADKDQPIYGVELQLRNGSDSIKKYTTDINGYITIDSTLVNGNYTIEMISAPDGYILDTVPKSIKVMVAETTEVVWKIHREGGQIQVEVRSADYNMILDKDEQSLLQGAVIQVINPDTYQIVDEIISDNRGMAASGKLPIGRYYLKMVTAPPYYHINESWQPEFKIKGSGQFVREKVTVKSIYLKNSIKLSSNSSATAGSNIKIDVTEAINKSDVDLDWYNLHIKFPTDSVRAVTMNTGVWNMKVHYNITYKTNMNDYRPLVSNLLSTSNYEYGISSESLGLQSGEYVTDIRFEFGTVPAGFGVKSGLSFTEYILSTVSNGYNVVQRIEIGGQYNTVSVGTSGIDNNNPYSGASVIDGNNSPMINGNSGRWSMSDTTWTTTVKGKSLPTTGY